MGKSTIGAHAATGHALESYKDICGKCGAQRIDRQIGQEPTPAAYVETLVSVFREVRRILHPSGVVFLNVGDSYASGGTGGYSDKSTLAGFTNPATKGRVMNENSSQRKVPGGLKPKDLCLIPYRLAIALQDDGWWVRSVICWAKKAPMPESVTDRPTNSWEPIFLLSKRANYFYDAEAVKEQTDESNGWAKQRAKGGDTWKYKRTAGGNTTNGIGSTNGISGTRNQRNVWHLSPEPFSEAHFATFVTEIPRRAIKAGTSEHGCCPLCKAPYERVVEKEGGVPDKNHAIKKVGHTQTGGKGTSTLNSIVNTTLTLGWQPTCSCPPATPIPCTVLDPFGGAGTTGMVALSLGRHAILCELSEEYAAMATARIEERATTNWQTQEGTEADFDTLPLFGGGQ